MPFRTRPARPDDTGAIARIYNEGIEDRLATFETDARGPEDVLAWLREGSPLVVAEDEEGVVVAWASAPPYREGRATYVGVREFSIYVAREARGHGAGRAALAALAEEAAARGHWKLLSRIFPENERASPSAGHSAFARWASTGATPSSTASGATASSSRSSSAKQPVTAKALVFHTHKPLRPDGRGEAPMSSRLTSLCF